ncbi:MAG TPA: hypothetical protein VGS28_00940 [Candidatus Saccharimonadales bacterium]|nr:hypothetical protein [Candidatus Saccharimonadales bacterium]
MNGKKAFTDRLEATRHKITSDRSSLRIGGDRPIMVPEATTKANPSKRIVFIVTATLVCSLILASLIRELVHIYWESATPIPSGTHVTQNGPTILPFSTSGTIYFISGFNSIAAMKANGAVPESVYTLSGGYQSQGQITSLNVLPNGSKIAFTYSQDTASNLGRSCIFSLSAGSTKTTSLTPGCTTTGSSDDDSQPVLSPDGKTVYFLSYGRTGGPGIFKEPISGGSVTLVVALPYLNPTTNQPILLSSLAISPNGKTLAFPYFRSSSLVPYLYTVGTDGTGLIQASSSPAYVDEVDGWSPDGQSLIAVTGSNNNYLRILSAGSGAVTRTLATASNVQAFAKASWSPDGKLVAYDLNGSLQNYNIFLISSTGGTSYQITDIGRNQIPVWANQSSPPLGGAPLN